MRSLCLFALAIAFTLACFQSADAGPIANLRARAGVSSSKTVVKTKTVAAPAAVQFQGYGHAAAARLSGGHVYGNVTVFRGSASAYGHAASDVIEEEVIIRRAASGSGSYQSFQGSAYGNCAPPAAAAFGDPCANDVIEKRTIRRSIRGAGGY